MLIIVKKIIVTRLKSLFTIKHGFSLKLCKSFLYYLNVLNVIRLRIHLSDILNLTINFKLIKKNIGSMNLKKCFDLKPCLGSYS